jgi:NDP-sugar pyrophosphorylase family protein
MKAFILAAGVGSRLRPLTDSTPKALISVAGVPMLERVLSRLREAGATSFVVNAHHHAQAISDFCDRLSRRHRVPIYVSREDDKILDTGGALKKAAPLLAGSQPFFLHNADILTQIDLQDLYATHLQSGALATLCVRERKSSRAYLFDDQNRFIGHDDIDSGRTTWAKAPVSGCQRLAFDGIHVISPELLSHIKEDGAFSITKTYLRLAASAIDIRAFRTDRWDWHDIGTVEKLSKAQNWAAEQSSL